MSYTRVDATPIDFAPRRGTVLHNLERVSRIVLWAIGHVVLLFAEHAAELAAPFLILGGVIWWAVPQVFAAITLDGTANDILQTIRGRIPHELLLGSHLVSASSLITYGILCIAVVAICRTVTTALTSLMLDRR